MVDVRPSNPVHAVEERNPAIASFEDSEWRALIELVRRYGFEPPDDQTYYPQVYDQPAEIDAEASQGLWEAISAAYTDEAVPKAARTWEVGKLRVKQLMACAQIGAEHGGIEIRRVRA